MRLIVTIVTLLYSSAGFAVGIGVHTAVACAHLDRAELSATVNESAEYNESIESLGTSPMRIKQVQPTTQTLATGPGCDTEGPKKSCTSFLSASYPAYPPHPQTKICAARPDGFGISQEFWWRSQQSYLWYVIACDKMLDRN